jgi:hypothetical protein
MSIELLKLERESVAKCFLKNLVIAQTFDRMGHADMALDHFSKAHIFAQRIWQIDSQIKQRQSI